MKDGFFSHSQIGCLESDLKFMSGAKLIDKKISLSPWVQRDLQGELFCKYQIEKSDNHQIDGMSLLSNEKMLNNSQQKSEIGASLQYASVLPIPVNIGEDFRF